MTEPYDWMPEAREQAAQCWCDEETKHIVMDPILAEAFARRLAFWMQTAALVERNSAYYRGLVERCGKAIGPESYIADDGSVADSVLCAKVPELVEKLNEKIRLATAADE